MSWPYIYNLQQLRNITTNIQRLMFTLLSDSQGRNKQKTTLKSIFVPEQFAAPRSGVHRCVVCRPARCSYQPYQPDRIRAAASLRHKQVLPTTKARFQTQLVTHGRFAPGDATALKHNLISAKPLQSSNSLPPCPVYATHAVKCTLITPPF